MRIKQLDTARILDHTDVVPKRYRRLIPCARRCRGGWNRGTDVDGRLRLRRRYLFAVKSIEICLRGCPVSGELRALVASPFDQGFWFEANLARIGANDAVKINAVGERLVVSVFERLDFVRLNLRPLGNLLDGQPRSFSSLSEIVSYAHTNYCLRDPCQFVSGSVILRCSAWAQGSIYGDMLALRAMPESEIVSVSTAVTAFIGKAARGPLNTATRCDSEACAEMFGGPEDPFELGYGVRQFFLNGGIEAFVVRCEDESEDSVGAALHALGSAETVNLLCLPGLWSLEVFEEAMEYCRSRRIFLLIDAPSQATPREIVSLMQTAGVPRSDCAALYYPWILVPHGDRAGRVRLTAPSGAVAGVFARTDAQRGVWKAPAGMDARLVEAEGTGYVLNDREHDVLNPLAVNCIRVFPNERPVIWGARTLAGNDGATTEWKYVSVRRTSTFIEQSVSGGLQWTVFEPNGEALWQRIRGSVSNFMHSLFLQGAFRGRTADEAYFVKCDGDTTRQSDINNGIVNVVVGFAPLKPAEFVLIRLSQIAATSQDGSDDSEDAGRMT